jgi:hypothetical protein
MSRVGKQTAREFVTQRQSVEPWLPLIASVLKQVNATVLAEKEVRARAEDQRAAARNLDYDSLDAEIARDGTDMWEFWRQYSIQERADIAALFRQFQERGKLSKDVLAEQFAAVQSGMTYKAVLHNGVVEPRMQFDKDPFLAREAKVALALLALAAEGPDGYRVLECPHNNCGRLFLRSPTERGPKRVACELHVGAYRIARHRAKRAKATRHK